MTAECYDIFTDAYRKYRAETDYIDWFKIDMESNILQFGAGDSLTITTLDNIVFTEIPKAILQDMHSDWEKFPFRLELVDFSVKLIAW